MLLYVFLFYFCIGAILGSFLYAWVLRKGNKKSIASGRSICVACNYQLSWYDNIPIVSIIMLKGKCRKCSKKIGKNYLLAELGLGLLFGWVAINFTGLFSFGLLLYLLIVCFLFFIFFYDIEFMEIHDETTIYPAIILFMISLIFSLHTWQSMLIGILVGAGFFWLQYVISKGKWIGGGDIRLGIFMGVILGWPHVLIALLLAYFSGAIIGVILIILKKKTLASETPFGTYLALATFITMIYGEQIVQWYLGLMI
jgi:prepilin signal peptidase PulO-like enzyme (type II secretory pathway)